MSVAAIQDEISEAIKAHSTWKLHLRTGTISGRLETPSRDICCDDKCKFGQWLHSPSTEAGMAGDANYVRAKKLHSEFHQFAGAIAQQIERGDLDAAKHDLDLGKPFDEKTKELTKHMMVWRKSLQ